MGSAKYPTLTDEFLMGIVDETFPSRQLIGNSILPWADTMTEIVKWDVKYGGTKLARFVAKDGPANVMKPKQVAQLLTRLLFVREKSVLEESELLYLRELGEQDPRKIGYSKKKVGERLMDLSSSIDLLIEWCQINALQGSLSYSSDDVSINIDYGFRPSHFVTPSVLWSNHANADILADFDAIQIQALDEGAPVITECIMNSKTYQHILQNQKIRDLLRYQKGEGIVTNGDIPVVRRVKITTYDVTYEDIAGTTQKMLADGKVLWMAKNGPRNESIGKTIQGPSKTNQGMPGRFSKSWDTDDPDDTWVLVGHYFVPVILYPDWIFVGTVL